MTWEGWFTLGLLAVMVYGLARYAPVADVIFLGGVTILGLAGIITPREALAGFSNAGMLTIAALFVVAAGLRETGALAVAAHRLLGHQPDTKRVLSRLLAPVAAVSALLNNTTIVAMAIPVLLDWCRKHRVAASLLLIPISYASIAGGVCTLIGTSTNLVVHGLMIEHGMQGMSFFEIGAVGAGLAAVTLVYLVLLSPKILPRRQEFVERLDATRREYIVEMVVEADCPFIGRTVQAAGLRQLPGLFLVEIDRQGHVLSPVGPDATLQDGDRLVFAGVVDTIVDLQKMRGLRPAAAEEARSMSERAGRPLCEAVVSASSPLVGRGIRETNFRTVYDAAVIAVHRNGQRLPGKIGDIVLAPGDTLLLQTAAGFVRAHRNNPDFYLVSDVSDFEPVRHERSRRSLVILLAMVVLMAAPDFLRWAGLTDDFGGRLDRMRVLIAMCAAGLMIVTRCVTASTARRNVQWQVLLVIAASFGIAQAMEKTGAAAHFADGFLPIVAPLGPVAALAVVYLLANILTELVTNNAAAALLFPIATATAANMGLDPRPFAIAVAVAASASFMTPIGYQTNMMIFGPGGYRFSDFVKAGLPLNLLWFAASMVLIPWLWPLTP
ncbi:MAG: SLC13 family permease [Phycisphaerae bacterium]